MGSEEHPNWERMYHELQLGLPTLSAPPPQTASTDGVVTHSSDVLFLVCDGHSADIGCFCYSIVQLSFSFAVSFY